MTKEELQVFSHDAELSVLSLLLNTPDRIYSLIDGVKAEMFVSSIHQNIYKAMVELFKAAGTFSAGTLKIYLSQTKSLDKAGGTEYIDMLTSLSPDDRSMDIYIKSIANTYKGKILTELSKRMPQAISDTSDINEVISNAKSILDGLELSGAKMKVDNLEDIVGRAWEKIQEKVQHPGITGISTGFNALDEFTGGYSEGTIWMLAGRPSMGKSSLLLKSLKTVAELDVPCMLFSREMTPQDLMERLLSLQSRVSYTDIRFGRLDEKALQKVKRAAGHYKKLPMHIDSNMYGDVNYIASAIRKYHRMHGVRIVGVDYIGLLAERSADQTAELGRISRMFKLLAMDLGITVVVLSQLNRQVEMRDDKRPILSDLRQSGNLEEDADVVVGLYREEVYVKNPENEGRMDFLVLKHRNGPIGTIPMRFEKEFTNILDNETDESSFLVEVASV